MSSYHYHSSHHRGERKASPSGSISGSGNAAAAAISNNSSTFPNNSLRYAATSNNTSSSSMIPHQQLQHQPTQTEYVEALRHMHKTEKIVRLEVQRRSIRDAIRIHDDMIEDLDAQLAYVNDFKREWLAHMQRLEDARRAVMDSSLQERGNIDAEWFRSTTDLVTSMTTTARSRSGGRTSSSEEAVGRRAR